MQKAVTLNTCRTVRKFLAEQWIRSAWSVRPYSFENRLNCCEVRNAHNNNNNNNNNLVQSPPPPPLTHMFPWDYRQMKLALSRRQSRTH
jgi:hypothetical protein